MAEKSRSDRQLADRTLVIERVFDAPPHVVLRAFTDPEQSEQWWGPRGYTAKHVESDVRPGGARRLCLRSADTGEEAWQGGIYREVVEPERLVFTFAWDDENGRRGHETLVTLTFAKGFASKPLQAHWLADYGADVIAPPQKTTSPTRPQRWSRAWRRFASCVRQIVETVNDKLHNSFRLGADWPHDLTGVLSRVSAKVALHNFCIWLNHRFGRPALASADLVDW